MAVVTAMCASSPTRDLNSCKFGSRYGRRGAFRRRMSQRVPSVQHHMTVVRARRPSTTRMGLAECLVKFADIVVCDGWCVAASRVWSAGSGHTRCNRCLCRCLCPSRLVPSETGKTATLQCRENISLAMSGMLTDSLSVHRSPVLWHIKVPILATFLGLMVHDVSSTAWQRVWLPCGRFC